MKDRYLTICMVSLVIIAICPLVSAVLIGGDRGNIRVHCNVDGASVSAGGYSCMVSGGECTMVVYTTATPVSEFSCSKAGYDTAYGSIPHMPAAGGTVDVFCTLNPVPPPVDYGTIYADSTPQNAAVYLNGNYRGVSPLTISQVRVGSYTVEFEISGYEPCSQRTSVQAGLQSNVYCSLKPISSPGSLYIISSPSDAMVYLDGAYKGRTPLSLSSVAPTTHTVELDLSGYYDWKSSVSVPSGGTRTVSASLVPIPSSNTGWISVTSNPAGATVYLDGAIAGQTASNGVLKIDNVRKGDHNVRVELAGYQPYATTVNVQVSTVSDVMATLVPTSSPGTTGTLAVTSAPAGASVFVDNIVKGVTPITLADIPAGSHQILLRLEGYQDYTTIQQVNAGATDTIMASLNPTTTPQPTRSGMMPVAILGALAIIGLFGARRKK